MQCISGLGNQSAAGHNHFKQLESQRELWPVVGVRHYKALQHAPSALDENLPQQREGSRTYPANSLTAKPTGAGSVRDAIKDR